MPPDSRIRASWTPSRLALLATGVIFVALCFSILPDGLVWNNDSTDIDAVGGSTLRRLQWMPLFLLAAYIVWRRRVVTLALLPGINPFLLVFIAYATLSVLWSPYPGVTVRKLVLLYGLVLIGLTPLVAGWYPGRFADLLRNAFTLMLVVSVFLALFLPQIGKEPDGEFAGYWRGARSTKNLLAALAAAGGLLWVHALATGRTTLARGLAGLAVATLCLLMSRGKTGLLTFVVSAPLLWLVARPPIRARYLLPTALLAGLVLLVVPLFAFILAMERLPTLTDITTPIALAVGKDPTLTSRDQLWLMMWEHIQSHWLLGFGYDSFWLGTTGPSGEIAEKLYWLPWQAHNGYVDLLNETGVVGVALFLGFALVHLRQILRLAAVDRGNAALHLALFVTILMSNVSESSLFRGLTIYWLMLLFSSLSLTRALSARVPRLLADAGGRTQAGDPEEDRPCA